MEHFNTQNTEGFTKEELDQLNHQFDCLICHTGIDLFTDEYYQSYYNFVQEKMIGRNVE